MRYNLLIIYLLLQVSSLNLVANSVGQSSDSTKIVFEAYGKKGLKNQNGEVLLAPKYQSLSWEENPNEVEMDVIPYQKNDHWGLFNNNLEEITEAKYHSLTPFDENTLVAAIKGKYSQV